MDRSKNSYEMEWYSQIPDELKVKKSFNEVIPEQSYINLIDALTTQKNNGMIVRVGYQLKSLQEDINELLKKQMIVDLQKIQAVIQNNTVPLFIDKTFSKFNNIFFHFTPLEIQNFDSSPWQWNYYFSQPNLIQLNPKILNNQLKGLKLMNPKFFYGYGENKIQKPKIIFLLVLNNAFYSQDMPYENEAQINGVNLLKGLFDFIKGDISENFHTYFSFKRSSKNKSPFAWTDNDYDETAKLKSLKKLLNIKLKFIRLKPFFKIYDSSTFAQMNWTAQVTLDLGSNDSLENSKYKKEEVFNVLVIQAKIQAESEFKTALELDPFFQRKLVAIPKSKIISEINDGKQKYFKFNNLVSNLNYKTIGAKQLANGDVKLTIEITSSVLKNLKKTYQKIVSKELFNVPDAFDIKAQIEAQKINNAIRQKYGDAIYSIKMNSAVAKELFFQNVLINTKTSIGFSDLNSEAKLNLFKINYQKALLALLLNEGQTPKNEIVEKINNYYEDLLNRLNQLLHQSEISPDSQVAKSLRTQLIQAHAQALADKNNFNQNNPKDQQLTDILNILNFKNIDQNLINNFGKFIEKYNYNDIQKVLNETQKSILYSVSGLAGIILLGSSYLMFHSMKIDIERFRIRKWMLGSLAGFLILASGASLIYLIVYLLGAI